MQHTVFVATLLASVVSARSFVSYGEINYGGAAHADNRNDDAACCMPILLFTNRGQLITKPREYERRRWPSKLCTGWRRMHHLFPVSSPLIFLWSILTSGPDSGTVKDRTGNSVATHPRFQTSWMATFGHSSTSAKPVAIWSTDIALGGCFLDWAIKTRW